MTDIKNEAPKRIKTVMPAAESGFNMKVDPPAEKKETPDSVINGELRGDWVEMKIMGTDKEMELMSKLIDLGAKKRGTDTIVMDIAYGETTALRIRCRWTDVALVSTIVNGVRDRM